MTRYPDIFAALAEPFDSREVKVLSVKGRQMHYITARTAMNRLDNVLGPENWWDDYIPSENSVLCRLTIRLPDGQVLTKADAGGYAGMADSGDDDKSGYSDAFKRAAVKFGVARYLYRDGVPSFTQEAPAPAEGGSPAPAAGKAKAEDWGSYIAGRLRKLNAEWLREMTREGIEPCDRAVHRELANGPQVVNHLCSRLIELKKLDGPSIAKPGKPEVRDPAKARDAIRQLFEKSPNAIKKGVEKYLKKKAAEARIKLGMPDLGGDGDGAPPPGKGDAYEDNGYEEALAN